MVLEPLNGTELPPSHSVLLPQLDHKFLMQEPSFLPRPPLTCTAGVRTPSSPLSSSLTARTASLSVRDPTSTLSNPTNTTPVPLMPVLTYILLLSALRSTNPLAAATSPELTTLSSSLFFLPTQLLAYIPPRYVSMPSITTYSV